jgi:hypothetical protein
MAVSIATVLWMVRYRLIQWRKIVYPDVLLYVTHA